MKTRLAIAAVLAGAVAFLLSLGDEPGAALREGPVAPLDRGVAAPTPEVRGADPRIEAAGGGVERGPVRPSATTVTRADRIAAVEAEAQEARANRQRLLFTTLTDLSSAAERAEREGKPEYAATLRHRAEILARSVRSE